MQTAPATFVATLQKLVPNPIVAEAPRETSIQNRPEEALLHFPQATLESETYRLRVNLFWQKFQNETPEKK
jgi:hypothetical protein